MNTLVDTGFSLAVFSKNDKNHILARRHFSAVSGALLLPAITLPEVTYHLHQLGGSNTVSSALRAIQRSRFEIIDMISEDYQQSATILEKYADTRIDFVDACIMALAERLKITRILTFDRRDFGIYRPAHCEQFDLLP
jgi:predicted nucleic acid-binding protein